MCATPALRPAPPPSPTTCLLKPIIPAPLPPAPSSQRAFYVLPLFVFLTFFMITVSSIGSQAWGACLLGASLLAPRTNAGHGKDADRPPPKLPCKPLLPNRVLACSAPPADLHHQGGRLALRLGEHPLQQGGQAASNPFKCPPGMCQAGQLLRVSCASAPQWILHASCPLPVCMADTHACAPCPTCLCRRPAGLVPLWVPAVPSSRSAGRCGAAGMRRQLTTPPAWL